MSWLAAICIVVWVGAFSYTIVRVLSKGKRS